MFNVDHAFVLLRRTGGSTVYRTIRFFFFYFLCVMPAGVTSPSDLSLSGEEALQRLQVVVVSESFEITMAQEGSVRLRG